MFDGDGGPAEHGGGGRVVGAKDEGDFEALGEVADLIGDVVAAGDDDAAGAGLDGGDLDVFPVTDNNEKAFGPVIGQARGERGEAHGADHEDQVGFLIGFEGAQHGSLEGAGEGTGGGEDASCVDDAGGRGEEELAGLEDGEQPAAAPLIVEDRQHADVAFVHEGEGLHERGSRRYREDVVPHHVGDPWGHVGDEAGRGQSKGAEDEVDAVVEIAAAGGDDVPHAGPALEFGVADGRADRIRVGIAVANDEDFTHARLWDTRRWRGVQPANRAGQGGGGMARASRSCGRESGDGGSEDLRPGRPRSFTQNSGMHRGMTVRALPGCHGLCSCRFMGVCQRMSSPSPTRRVA